MLQQIKQGVLITIKVVPKASANEVMGWENRGLKIRLAATPEKGEANTELIRFLSSYFNISKSKIELVKGLASRHKQILLKDLSLSEVEVKLKGTFKVKNRIKINNG